MTKRYIYRVKPAKYQDHDFYLHCKDFATSCLTLEEVKEKFDKEKHYSDIFFSVHGYHTPMYRSMKKQYDFIMSNVERYKKFIEMNKGCGSLTPLGLATK